MSDKKQISIIISKNNYSMQVVAKIAKNSERLMEADIVSGCEDSGTPTGNYRTGRWIKDKTNPIHGPTPWSKDSWNNPYGPYFLPLHDADTNRYTTFGIHGTRGPLIGNFEKPPLPRAILNLVLDDNTSKYLYCSHGCIRLSNQNIVKLFNLTTMGLYAFAPISVVIQ